RADQRDPGVAADVLLRHQRVVPPASRAFRALADPTRPLADGDPVTIAPQQGDRGVDLPSAPA
ncbi:MAG TPA: hypothetical protein VJT67_10375, partial [Longimicrobiaceae bacterium]|nr:hypothetical protein [Longimicrobiaceae bacterium]